MEIMAAATANSCRVGRFVCTLNDRNELLGTVLLLVR
jgi:hypothetical protein